MSKQSAAAPKITVATAWLDGCSGCHMSFLDMDERLVDLAQLIDVVYSPLVDAKELPEQVDLGILEGSISNSDDLDKAKAFRKHCKLLISLGDCAVNGNVPAMRNPFKLGDVIDRAYRETVDVQPQTPCVEVPTLLAARGAHPQRGAGGCLRPRLPAPGGRHLVCPHRADRRAHAGQSARSQSSGRDGRPSTVNDRP